VKYVIGSISIIVLRPGKALNTTGMALTTIEHVAMSPLTTPFVAQGNGLCSTFGVANVSFVVQAIQHIPIHSLPSPVSRAVFEGCEIEKS